jgi:hypothetical protein
MILARHNAYKVLMKRGILTKEIWTHHSHYTGQLVKDETGRLFRVIECKEVEYNGVALTKLYDNMTGGNNVGSTPGSC